MSTAKIRVALYCRVSTLDKGQDVENQLKQLRQFVTTNRRRVVPHSKTASPLDAQGKPSTACLNHTTRNGNVTTSN